MKRIEIDGRFFRIRRGQLVAIPDHWVDDVTRPQTIRKRKALARSRKRNHEHRKFWKRSYIEFKQNGPSIEEFTD